jgi:hypothetical protein
MMTDVQQTQKAIDSLRRANTANLQDSLSRGCCNCFPKALDKLTNHPNVPTFSEISDLVDPCIPASIKSEVVNMLMITKTENIFISVADFFAQKDRSPSFREEEIHWTTPEIAILDSASERSIDFGRFIVTHSLERFNSFSASTYIQQATIDRSKRRGPFIHPHGGRINENGQSLLCLGENTYMLKNALLVGDLVSFALMIETILQNIGPNPYASLLRWIYPECSSCQSTHTTLRSCNDCQLTFCSNCGCDCHS